MFHCKMVTMLLLDSVSTRSFPSGVDATLVVRRKP